MTHMSKEPTIEELQNRIKELEKAEIERKKIDETIEYQWKTYEYIIEQSMAGYWDWDISSSYEYLSPTFKKMLGYEEHELENNIESWQNLIFPEDLSYTMNCFNLHVESRGKKPFYTEVRYHHKNGSTVWVICRGQIVEWDKGNPKRMVGCHIDITERKKAEEALKESKLKAEQYLNVSAEIIISLDRQGIITLLNDNGYKLLNYDKDELIGKNWFKTCLEEDTESNVFEVFKKLMNDEEIENVKRFENKVKTKNGLLLDIFWHNTLLRDSNNNVIGLLSSGKDITERKIAEEMLLTSEIKYRRLFETAKDGILILDAETGMIVDVNPFLVELLGYSFESFLNKTIWDVGFFKDIIKNKDKFLELQENKYVRYDDLPLETFSGKVIDVEFVSSVYYIDNKKVIQCNIRDITDRKLAEESKIEEQKFSKAMIDSIPGTFYMLNEKGYYVGWNAYQRDKIVGKPDNQMTFVNAIDTIHPDDREIVGSKIKNVLQNGKSEIITGRVLLCGGPEFKWLLMTGRLITIKEKSFLIGIGIDITDQKKSEEERLKLESKLIQTQKMESIGFLAGGIAHDLNNILFPICGLSELLLNDIPQDTDEYKSIDQIHKSAQRGSDLVKQILAFSRQSNTQKLPLMIQPILKEVLKLASATIPKNIEINSIINKNCGMISADPTQIHQIVMNLITNAFHAVEKINGKIDVTLEEIIIESSNTVGGDILPGKYACISVSDTGTGIKKNLIDKIFEPYFTTKELGKGTGLGLSVVHGIVKDHGGDIRVYSEIGKGTIFHVYLPLIKSAESTKDAPTIQQYPRGNERILLVDDEKPIVLMEQTMLEKLGYKTTIHTNSLDALSDFKLRPNYFDLVISDRGMPNLTGEQLAKELLLIKPEIPIILCTGFINGVETTHNIDIKGFLIKPMTIGDLSNMVRKVLDS